MKGFFVCRATWQVGAGHATRCLALAQQLALTGPPSTVMGSIEVPWLRHAWQAIHAPMMDHAWPPLPRDVARDAAVAHADWIVVDDYALGSEWVAELAESTPCPVLAIWDDLVDPPAASMVLNQNLDAERHVRAGSSAVRAGPRVLLAGARFALLRSGVVQAARKGPLARAGHALVMAGGTDAAGMRQRLTQVALDAGAPAVRVLGADGAAAAAEPDARVVSTPSSPEPFMEMARAACCFTAAGSTAWELAALGTPMFVAPVADNQRALAEALARNGAAVVLPAASSWDHDQAVRLARQALGRPDMLLAMAARAQELVDGLGARRVAAMMRAYSQGSTEDA